ncbi:flagellar basal body P-ring protein FlgI [Silvibacterium sp.]|uniref:flagellar basal body P-ring protein FlgI n=1 Tax=Silvibacterium sp. TaxID=1964179 RepID=UPI0039E61D94
MYMRGAMGEMTSRQRRCFFAVLFLLIPLARAACGQLVESTPARRARIKDIASVEGIRDNQLVGYGIVVGLKGTGDSTQAVFPIQTLISTLLRMGVNLPNNSTTASLRTQNMAAVFIAATLPPFAQPGNRLDVTVSSAGDARSIEGGLLLMTPLYGPDGQIYAEAQGPLVLGGYTVAANGNSRSLNHPTTGLIPSGGIVERSVPLDLSKMRRLTLLLSDPDFRTAEEMAAAVNKQLRRSIAHAIDSRSIEVQAQDGEDIPNLLADVEAIEVDVYPRAKVVVNERTGTVVIGGNVCLQPVSILHGGLSINVVSQYQVSQPGPFSSGTTQVVQQTQVQAQDKPVSRIELKAGSTVDNLVQNLQSIGATARDVISILQAMKQAGALEAELEVM